MSRTDKNHFDISPESKICGVVSLSATLDKEANLTRGLTAIKYAKNLGAQWVFLPEMWSFHGPYDLLSSVAEDENGPLNEVLRETAQKLQISIFAGSVPERVNTDSSDKVYNTQYVFGPNGDMIAKYRKIHLFNLLSSTKEKLYCESDGYLSGDRLISFCHEGWLIGLVTCYDLRFSGLFSAMNAKTPMELIVAPSAFTLQTGMDHWHLATRWRAIENLCYVVAANQYGTHSPGKQSYGHSVIVDPWGTVLADSGAGAGVCLGILRKDVLEGVRMRLPIFDNRVDFDGDGYTRK